MTERQEAVLRAWVAFEARAGLPPTAREAADEMGLAHTSGVTSCYPALIWRGYMEWNPELIEGAPRAYRVTNAGRSWVLEDSAA